MEKIDKLQQLMKLLQNDTITPQEVEKFLVMVVESVKKAKDNFETISQETLTEVSTALAYIETEHSKILDKAENLSQKAISDVENRLQSVTQMIADLKEMKPKDGEPGKDADEEYIISEVLNRIELPEQKEFEYDTGEDIIEKINQLSTDEKYKIDASHIKNLPSYNGGVGSQARNLWQLQDVALSSPSNNDVLKYNSTTEQWENGTGDSSPLTTKGDLYTYSTVNDRLPIGTDGQVLVADSSASTGLSWINSSGITTTLRNVSDDSTTSATSLYQMTSTIPVEFKTSDANTLLYLDETNEAIGIGTSSPDRKFHEEVSDAVTNAVTYTQRHSHITSGTATTNFGIGEEYELENASGTNRIAGTQEYVWTTATNTVENAKFEHKLIRAGTLTTALTLSAQGELTTVRYLVEANTAGSGSPNIITAAESRTVFTNEGATALNYHTLPTAVAGLSYTFYVDDADGIRVTADTGDIIQINGVASASAGYTQCLAIGGSITLVAINATDWVATSVIGTWTLT